MTTKLINLPHLADMVFGVPHYVTRQTMDSVKAVLIPRIQGITEDTVIQMALNPGKSPAAEQVQPTGGVAVIPVHGILVPRRGQITAMCSELTSYERIRGQLQAALNNPQSAKSFWILTPAAAQRWGARSWPITFISLATRNPSRRL